MVDLALSYESGEYVSTAVLAASQNISEGYLEKQISSLKKAGLIESTRGIFGGSKLSRAPKDINVGEIIRAIEGKTAIADCVDTSAKHSCGNACVCSARPLWLKLQHRIDEVLNTTTLKDMADDYITQADFFNNKSIKLNCQESEK